MIFLSHSGIREIKLLRNLTNALLSKDKIKKIYILETEYEKIPKPVPVIIKELKYHRLSKSEFLNLLENRLYEYNIIYEVFKDKYY